MIPAGEKDGRKIKIDRKELKQLFVYSFDNNNNLLTTYYYNNLILFLVKNFLNVII